MDCELEIAYANRNFDTFKSLLSRSDLNSISNHKVFSMAIADGEALYIQALIGQPKLKQDTVSVLFREAVESNQIRIIKILLSGATVKPSRIALSTAFSITARTSVEVAKLIYPFVNLTLGERERLVMELITEDKLESVGLLVNGGRLSISAYQNYLLMCVDKSEMFDVLFASVHNCRGIILFWADKEGHTELADKLREAMSVAYQPLNQQLKLAVESDDLANVRSNVDISADNYSALRLALVNDNLDVAKALLQTYKTNALFCKHDEISRAVGVDQHVKLNEVIDQIKNDRVKEIMPSEDAAEFYISKLKDKAAALNMTGDQLLYAAMAFGVGICLEATDK